MGLRLDLADMRSRLTRTEATGGGLNGIRRIAVSALSAERGDDQGLLSYVWDVGKKLAGFLSKVVFDLIKDAVKITFSFIWGKIVAAKRFIWTFNWNQSDESLDASLEAAWNQFGGSLGGFTGNALGWGVCGVGGALALASFNEPLALYVLKEVGEEALEEVAANLGNVIRIGTDLMGRAMFNSIYKGGRRFLDLLLDAQLGSGVYSDTTIADVRKEREEERKKPWSFAIAWEEKIESIPNKFIQNFVEEFFEELDEACIEAGYVVADSMDTFFIKQKQAQEDDLGETRTIEIDFDRGVDDE